MNRNTNFPPEPGILTYSLLLELRLFSGPNAWLVLQNGCCVASAVDDQRGWGTMPSKVFNTNLWVIFIVNYKHSKSFKSEDEINAI